MYNFEDTKNKAVYERHWGFDYLNNLSSGPGGERISLPPIEYLENGDIIIRMQARGAKTVTAESDRMALWNFKVDLHEVGAGIFEGVLPHDLNLNGDVIVKFSVDGIDAVNPSFPSEVFGEKIANCIEVPDSDTPYVYLRDVPHGSVSREIFWSDTVKQWISCLVYTPPGYQNGGEYPVLYIQHGGGENETCWVNDGKLHHILDNTLAEGKCVPFVAVMNNGMLRKEGQHGMNDFEGIEGIITTDCRNYIESKYHVKKDKWNRAIAGLSLGSMQACYIGMRNPDLFGSIGSFTYMRCRDKDNTYEGNPHLDALKDYDKFTSEHKLFFRSIGSVEHHMNEFEEDDNFLAQYGIDKWDGYVRKIIPGQTHNWNCWRRALREFAQVVFK